MKETKEDVCVKILERLFLGNYKGAMSKTLLTTNNIKSILCVGIEMNTFYPKDKINFKKIDIFDSEDEDILYNFQEIYKY